MSYDVYWVKNRAEKIADFEHPTYKSATEAVLHDMRGCVGV